MNLYITYININICSHQGFDAQGWKHVNKPADGRKNGNGSKDHGLFAFIKNIIGENASNSEARKKLKIILNEADKIVKK